MPEVYKVEINHEGSTQTIDVPSDRKILEVALEKNIPLPYSCMAGVCTTCAAKLSEGKVEQEDAMGVSPALQAEGYSLLCVAYPRANIKLESDKEEEVYERQFGQ
ncbi:MAG: 2Fe-2S iron-sulfur cluster-binding protein [Cyanobacteria bacterium P01_G01_bin.54]